MLSKQEHKVSTAFWVWWSLHWCCRNQHCQTVIWSSEITHSIILFWSWLRVQHWKNKYWWLWFLWQALHILWYWGRHRPGHLEPGSWWHPLQDPIHTDGSGHVQQKCPHVWQCMVSSWVDEKQQSSVWTRVPFARILSSLGRLSFEIPECL